MSNTDAQSKTTRWRPMADAPLDGVHLWIRNLEGAEAICVRSLASDTGWVVEATRRPHWAAGWMPVKEPAYVR